MSGRHKRALLNERVRLINNSITMFKIQQDTCINTLENEIDRETMQDCFEFIKVRREARCLKTLERQLVKFHRLCHKNTSSCSSLQHAEHGRHGCIWSKNNTDHIQNTSKNDNKRDDIGANSGEDNKDNDDSNKYTIRESWVRNISKTPLTEARECLLAHGSNFVVVPKEPSICEYIVAIEKACFKTDSRQGRRAKRRN